MIQINNTVSRDLEAIAKAHFEGVIRYIQSAINKYVPLKQRNFLIDNLQIIIQGKPDELLKINRMYKNHCLRNNTPFNKGIAKSFSYQNFSSRRKYNIYDLSKTLQINVCPYCNRQYTFTVISNSKKITRPEFDHFFCKEKYPLLSLSFYNLIPSCVICNSHLKGRKLFSLKKNLHPYLYGFDTHLKFNYNPFTINGALGNTDEIEVKLESDKECKNRNKIKGNCDAFHLEEIYQMHKDSVREILRKHYVSGGKYLKVLAKTFPELNVTTKELYQIGFGNYYDNIDFHNRPLGKLTKDIFEQLKFDVI